MHIVDIILGITGVAIVGYSLLFAVNFFKYRMVIADHDSKTCAWWKTAIIGFFAYFLDALGIGSFAVTTAAVRSFKQVRDLYIPGTLNVAFAVAALVETLIYVKAIKVDPVTFISMVVFSTLGGWLGAAVVARFSERMVRLVMGIALMITALVMLAGNLHLMPIGGFAIGLHGWELIVALIGIAIIGALGAVGIGLFAPCMAMLYLMGMSARATFPIMMAACAFAMMASSIKFMKERAYSPKAALNLGFFAIFGVLIAAYIVKSLPLDVLTWLVVCIIFYVAISMLISARRGWNKQTTDELEHVIAG
ncbi:MAG: sulfite exporter TauE/SafE family protein [Gammaproteobacteria bacterium]|nr:sulfite exporter TauE/SafE family protein [Gammaproteobacteria bacterium]